MYYLYLPMVLMLFVSIVRRQRFLKILSKGSPIDLIEASDGFYTKTYLQVSAEGEAKPLNLPNDCDVVGYLAGHLLLTLRKDWNRANQSYPSGALVAVKLNRGELGAAQLLFAPDETQALESVETTKRFVVASLLGNHFDAVFAGIACTGDKPVVAQIRALEWFQVVDDLLLKYSKATERDSISNKHIEM